MAKKGLSWPEGLVCDICGGALEIPPGTPPKSEVVCTKCGSVYETTIV